MTVCQLPLLGHQQLQEKGVNLQSHGQMQCFGINREAAGTSLGTLLGLPPWVLFLGWLVNAWLRHPDIPSGFGSQSCHTNVPSSHAQGMKKPDKALRNVLGASTQKSQVFVTCYGSC